MVDRRERVDDPVSANRAMLKGWQSAMWTALPGIVKVFDPVKLTCQVQPTLQATVRDPQGVVSWVNMPLLVDCPVVFPSGGGFTLTFPIKVGDEVLVVFASRCIDSWWQSGGIQIQAEMRMHDLSDGFVLPGPRSLKRPLVDVSTSDVQLRSDDGTAYFSIDADKNIHAVTPGSATVTAAGGITLNGDVTVNGNITVSGLVTAHDFATADLPSYSAHTHIVVVGSPFPSNPPTSGT